MHVRNWLIFTLTVGLVATAGYTFQSNATSQANNNTTQTEKKATTNSAQLNNQESKQILQAASTGDAQGVPPEIYTKNGVAIEGADPVAYFTNNAYVPGKSEYSYQWAGATWHFANANHRDRFAENPTKYAPKYGGFCAWAVSQGYTASIDPKAWNIVDGNLYLNYSQKIKQKWERNMEQHIAQADQNWPDVLNQ